MQTIDALDTTLRGYLNAEQANQVKRAYFFAEQAHYGQRRQSGEPYVTHPLAVAGILADMHMDHQSLMAAMLHDVIEDTGIEKSSIGEQFGQPVAELVDGVSKLTNLEFETLEEKQAENFQKMALAMARDIRVILVKLADRLHNMRTLGVLSNEKARRIAKETLDIYSPIAMRLGMNNVRMEFEDLGFGVLHPMRATRIETAIHAARGHRKELVEKIGQQIQATLEQEGHHVSVVGREKHLYSIYLKMKQKRKSFNEIMDIYAFRIIVDSVDTCYRVLGCVHSMYKPRPGGFKDYIAIPKANGYQSLHTVVMGMHGVPIEVQIRTQEMEDMANNGIAAHWLYKSDSQSANGSHTRAREWVQGLLLMQQQAGNSLEFIDSVKMDLFPDEIYVFTPKGRILELPRKATPVDFAYAVHTDVGNACVACRINRHLSPLSQPLESGQTVEILTSTGARPNPAWLDYAVTAKARSNIHHFLKHQTREDSVSLGRALLDKALAGRGGSLDNLADRRFEEFLSAQNYDSADDLMIDIARGHRLPAFTAQQLMTPETGNAPQQDSAGDAPPVAIRGTEGFMLSYARCCHPLPGDPIMGYLSSEKGVVVHREQCKNLGEMREDHRERLVALRWDEDVEGDYPVELRIEVENRRGMIAVIATRINSFGVNIEKISTESKDYQLTYVNLEMMVQSRVHLARIMKRLRDIQHVLKVTRVKN